MCKEYKQMIDNFKKEIELKTKTADIYVRKHPYESIGVAVGVAVGTGLLIGYLLGSRSRKTYS